MSPDDPQDLQQPSPDRSLRLDAVLPLTPSDAERARILFASLERFFEPLGACFVVAPEPLDVPGWCTVVAETDLVPELRTLHPRPPGWYVQQVVKLAIAERVETPVYLTLDADVFCVRPTRFDDLVRGGRALAQITPPHHPEWNDAAEAILGLPRSGRQHGVTPALLVRDGVRALAEHLESREPGWRRFLLRNTGWTEYALYNTFLEAMGRWDALHVDGGEQAIYGNCVWMSGQWDDWRFRADGPYRFSVVQSSTRIPPRDVGERVEVVLAAASP
jgi:hypothetical protein